MSYKYISSVLLQEISVSKVSTERKLRMSRKYTKFHAIAYHKINIHLSCFIDKKILGYDVLLP